MRNWPARRGVKNCQAHCQRFSKPCAKEPLRLKNVTAPVLNIFASKDHLVPPSASIPLGAHIGSKDYEALEIDAGHIGLYVGGKTRKTVPAAVKVWLQKRN